MNNFTCSILQMSMLQMKEKFENYSSQKQKIEVLTLVSDITLLLKENKVLTKIFEFINYIFR